MRDFLAAPAVVGSNPHQNAEGGNQKDGEQGKHVGQKLRKDETVLEGVHAANVNEGVEAHGEKRDGADTNNSGKSRQ